MFLNLINWLLILSHRRSDGPWLDGSELKRAQAAGVPPDDMPRWQPCTPPHYAQYNNSIDI